MSNVVFGGVAIVILVLAARVAATRQPDAEGVGQISDRPGSIQGANSDCEG